VSTFSFFDKISLKGCDLMGRPKGGKNRTWSIEEKIRIVKRNLEERVGQAALAKEENISRGMLWSWIDAYLELGEKGLVSQNHKRGNRFAALSNSKSLSELDRLRLENAKQKIEIERLKKGYTVKGVGASKEFVITNDANLK
jgi:transposase-like protein